MKKTFVVLSVLLSVVFIASLSFAGSVKGYVTKSGTYVPPHFKSTPNATVQDNYSYKGNANPYTGKTGSNLYKSSPTSAYYDPTAKKVK
jgi:hypothetical protein